MSARGRVSRASPVQTVARNYTRDEGRPFEAGSQVQVSNRCKLLSSKAMVVSVAVNVGTISRRVGLREASASKPSMKCRKRIRRCQNRGVTLPPGSARGCLIRPERHPACRRREARPGFRMERENLYCVTPLAFEGVRADGGWQGRNATGGDATGRGDLAAAGEPVPALRARQVDGTGVPARPLRAPCGRRDLSL